MYRSQSPGWVGCADASGLFDHAIKIIRDKFETLVLRPAIVRGAGIKKATATMKIGGVGCAYPLDQNSLRKDAWGVFFDRPLELRNCFGQALARLVGPRGDVFLRITIVSFGVGWLRIIMHLDCSNTHQTL